MSLLVVEPIPRPISTDFQSQKPFWIYDNALVKSILVLDTTLNLVKRSMFEVSVSLSTFQTFTKHLFENLNILDRKCHVTIILNLDVIVYVDKNLLSSCVI